MKDILNKIKSSITGLIVKGLIKAVDDSNGMQLVKVSTLANETIDGIERMQDYGFTSVPPTDSEALVLFLNGKKDHGVVVKCDSAANRPSLYDAGAVAVYSLHGQSIYMGVEGDTLVDQPGTFNVGDNHPDFVALAEETNAKIEAIYNAVASAAVSATDGGATFKSNIIAALDGSPDWVASIASTNLKAQ